MTGKQTCCTSTILDPFLFLDGLEPSPNSRSARFLPSSRACRRSKAVRAPPPPLGKSSSLGGAAASSASSGLLDIMCSVSPAQCHSGFQILIVIVPCTIGCSNLLQDANASLDAVRTRWKTMDYLLISFRLPPIAPASFLTRRLSQMLAWLRALYRARIVFIETALYTDSFYACLSRVDDCNVNIFIPEASSQIDSKISDH